MASDSCCGLQYADETWEEQWPLECTSLNTTADEGITNACFSSLYVKVR